MIVYDSVDILLNDLKLSDGMQLSFHHHLRDGDHVINQIMNAVNTRDIHDLRLHPSSIFPSYTAILEALKRNRISQLTTSYMNGPVAEYCMKHPLKHGLHMQTHGGRARAIMTEETVIDIAFIAAPTVDVLGNATGTIGPAACGSLGYAIADAKYAKTVILVTDNIIDHIENPQIKKDTVSAILKLKSIGDPKGIISGTTTITNDPVGIQIAKKATRLIEALGYIKPGFSFQTGAGGISLKISENIKQLMQQNNIQSSFITGGITQYHVEMLNLGMVKSLYDVQCFDLVAVDSLKNNPKHRSMSAHEYANPENPNRVIKNLDVVVLGATEIDLDFNVNVTTDSYNMIIGGSGGHSDTAEDAKLSIIVAPLIKARTPIIKQRVNTITTPGHTIDCFVCERGIAVNPRRQDLIKILEKSHVSIIPIEDLLALSHDYTGIPESFPSKKEVIGNVYDRHGRIIDYLYLKE